MREKYTQTMQLMRMQVILEYNEMLRNLTLWGKEDRSCFSDLGYDRFLSFHKFIDPFFRQHQHFIELSFAVGRFFSG